MTCKEIYDGALKLIGEPCCDADASLDYEERAPYLLAAFCCEAGSLDRAYREANGLDEQEKFSPVCLSLTEPFPLSERFSSPAVHYLAAMLLIDEDSELSDKLFALSCDKLSSVYAEIPSQMIKIKNKYI